MRSFILAIATVVLMAPAIPALAGPPPWAPAHGRREKERHHHDRDSWRARRHEPRVLGSSAVIFRGRDGRYYCRRSDGTTGLVVGAAIGGLIGNRLARGDSATLATIVGAGAGALLGQAIDRGSLHCE